MGSDVRHAVARATQNMRRRAWGAREGLRRLGSKVTVEGEGNVLDLGKARLHGTRIEIRGNHNVIRFHPTCKLVNVSFQLLGDDLRVELGERVKISRWGEFLLMGRDAEIRLGHHTTVESARFVAHGGTTLEVGPDCMFAYDVEVRTSDEHSILDAQSGERINPDASVRIGEHVWFGARSVVLKGVRIGNDSVIATGSIVSRDLGAAVVAGGIPAEEIRDGVTWDRRRL
ncbi:MAG: acyltransferase [Deltaproteobacteria bacterium]|nr:acyltransferase [Deltaproteobacteria bacterium]